MNMAFLRGLGKAPTFLVPIINPPFADNSPHNPPGGLRHPDKRLERTELRIFRARRRRTRAAESDPIQIRGARTRGNPVSSNGR